MTLPKSNYTQYPNAVLDSLHTLTCAELKVFSLICRQTLGWHRAKHKMSLSFLVNGTGLSKQGVLNATESLIEKGWITKEPSGISSQYGIDVPEEGVHSVDKSTDMPTVHSVDKNGCQGVQPMDRSEAKGVQPVGTKKESQSKEKLEKEKGSAPEGSEDTHAVSTDLLAKEGVDLLSEFEDEFWPLAYKKSSKAAARRFYVTARTGNKKTKRPPVPKHVIMDAWKVSNDILFPDKNKADRLEAEMKGKPYRDKQYIPGPDTWLSQERWTNGDVLELLAKQATSTSSNPVATEPEIRAEHQRLCEPGSMILAASGFRRFGVTTVTDLMRNPAEAADYLAWLKAQATPEFDDYPMAM